MILIGLAGKKRTGKSTCANYLWEKFGFTQYAFADPLKRMLRAMGLRDYELEERKEYPLYRLGSGRRPRDLMQSLGTEWGRNMVDGDLWVKLADAHISEAMTANPERDRWVISDIRFENEARWVRERGGTVVHIRRETDTADTHISEQGIEVKRGDEIIYNTGSISQFGAQTRRILSERGIA